MLTSDVCIIINNNFCLTSQMAKKQWIELEEDENLPKKNAAAKYLNFNSVFACTLNLQPPYSPRWHCCVL